LVGAARDLGKAKAATAEVRADAANGGGLKLVELDLASLASVRACADALLTDGRTFDLVIANAGVMGSSDRRDRRRRLCCMEAAQRALAPARESITRHGRRWLARDRAYD